MKTIPLIAFAGLTAAFSLGVVGAANETQTQQPQMIVHLSDGSRIVGSTHLEELPVKSPSLGKLRVPLAELDRLELDPQREESTVHLRNGDRLRAFVDLERLELDTTLGRLSLPLEIVLRLDVRSDAGSLTRGLVAYWNFDDGRATDASGHGQDGQVFGDPKRTDGIRGKAFQFDGQDDWIKVEHSPDLDLKENLSLCAWIRYSSVEGGYGSQIVWFGDARPATDPYEIHLLSDGRYEFRLDLASGGQTVTAVTPQPLKPEQWYFLTATLATRSKNHRVMKIYVNGELVRSGEADGGFDYDTSRMWLAIGAVDSGGWQRFRGLIDEVRIYNRPLSSAEIRTLYGACARE